MSTQQEHSQSAGLLQGLGDYKLITEKSVIAGDGTTRQLITYQDDGGHWRTALLDARPIRSRHIRTLAEFNADWRPSHPVIEGVFQRRYIYSMTAPNGAGKTGICLTLALHVATGAPLAGREVHKGRVLYFAGDAPDDTRSRTVAMCEKAGLNAQRVPIDIADGVYSMEGLIREAHARAREVGGYALVIVDTSAAYYPSDDENDNVKMRRWAQQLRRGLTSLAGEPASIIACHPSYTTPRRPRGGSAFLAELDGNTYLEAAAGDAVCLHRDGEKFRGPEFDPVPFGKELLVSDTRFDEAGNPETSIRYVPLDSIPRDEKAEEQEQAILDVIVMNPDLSLMQIAEAAGVLNKKGEPAKNRVDRLLRKMAERGLVTQGENGRWHPTKAGREAHMPAPVE